MRDAMILATLVALVLSWLIQFHAPTMHAAHPCPVGCSDTTSVPVPLTDLAGFEVWWHRQSPKWVEKHVAMQADSATWTRYWPTVVAEASWRRYALFPTTPDAAGAEITITMPDSLPLGRWYAVISVDSKGNRSCLSNQKWR